MTPKFMLEVKAGHSLNVKSTKARSFSVNKDCRYRLSGKEPWFDLKAGVLHGIHRNTKTLEFSHDVVLAIQ